jgi:hypothetical protein
MVKTLLQKEVHKLGVDLRVRIKEIIRSEAMKL